MVVLVRNEQWWFERLPETNRNVLMIFCPYCGEPGMLLANVLPTGETVRPIRCWPPCDFIDVVQLEGWKNIEHYLVKVFQDD